MYEVRMVGVDGKLVKTADEKTAPVIPYALPPNTVLLGDYCFNDEGRWINPFQILRSEDVAAVIYNKRGRRESMVVGEHRIHSEDEMERYMSILCQEGAVLTRYPAKEGKELFMFFLSPRVKMRMAHNDRRVCRSVR